HDAFPILALAAGAHRKVWEPFLGVIAAAGSSSFWARDLPGKLQRLGLKDVAAEVQAPLFPGGSSHAEFWTITWNQVRDRIFGAGVREEDLDQAIRELADPARWFPGPAMVAVWGRR